MKKIILITGLLILSISNAQVKVSSEEALEDSYYKCFRYNTACSLGADIAHELNTTLKYKKEKIESSFEQCSSDMETERRIISCLQGALFYFSKVLGEQKIQKKAFKTIPFITYTSGHSLGVTVSSLNYIGGLKNHLAKSQQDCEKYSFDRDVLKRCKQGLKSFKQVLSSLPKK